MGFAEKWEECSGDDREDSKWEGARGGEFCSSSIFFMVFVGMVENLGKTFSGEEGGVRERISANVVVM